MNEPQPTKELRFKGSETVLGYIRRFSSTEKALFGSLVVLALAMTVYMADQVNAHFLVQVPAYGGELREGLIGLPRTVNPVLAVTDIDRDISELVYAGLTKYGVKGISADLAVSYSVSDDGLTYTFNLRPNARFQDGVAVTADDVAYTIQKIQDPAIKSPRYGDWVNVTVKVVSPLQIQFILKQAYAPFITNTMVGIIPKHVWQKVTDDQFIYSQYNSQPIGGGPYKVTAVNRDSGGIPTSYRLSTWSGYYDKIPYLSTITFDFFADQDKALAALDSGTIDSLPSVSPDAAARLATNTAQAYSVLKSPLPRVFGVFLNQSQVPAFADKNVRQALMMTVDRPAIVTQALSGYGISLSGPLPPGMATADDMKQALVAPDIAGAQALLERNGWKKNDQGIYQKTNKKDITTLAFDIYTVDAPDLKQTADMLKDSWTKLGAAVTVKIFDASDLYQSVIRTRKYDALLFGQFIGKDRDLYAFWHSSERNAPGLNVAMYANSKADKLLEDIRTESDPTALASDYGQFGDIIQSDLPAIFLYAPDFIYVVPKIAHNIELGSITTASDRWNSVALWYTMTDRIWSIFAKH